MVFFRNSDEAVRLLYTRQLGEPLRANPGEVSMISTLLMDDDVVRPQVDAGADVDLGLHRGTAVLGDERVEADAACSVLADAASAIGFFAVDCDVGHVC